MVSFLPMKDLKELIEEYKQSLTKKHDEFVRQLEIIKESVYKDAEKLFNEAAEKPKRVAHRI